MKRFAKVLCEGQMYEVFLIARQYIRENKDIVAEKCLLMATNSTLAFSDSEEKET